MERRAFLSLCGLACLSAAAGGSLLTACSSARPVTATRQGNDLMLAEAEFSKGEGSFRRSLVIPHEGHSIAVYRMAPDRYSAVLMQCTHQGAELTMNGDMLTCPAHGSEFDREGKVLEGPAATALTQFKTRVDGGKIYIQLS